MVLQYLLRSDGYKECHIIGKYDPVKDDSSFSLLDSSDPSKGVSLTYAQGDRCESNSLTNYRMATLDVECANTNMEIVSAQEPSTCDYHLVMKSYYGCPTVRDLWCPTTVCIMRDRDYFENVIYIFINYIIISYYFFCNRNVL